MLVSEEGPLLSDFEEVRVGQRGSSNASETSSMALSTILESTICNKTSLRVKEESEYV